MMLSVGLAYAIDAGTILKHMLESEGKVAFTAHQVTTLAKDPPLTSEQVIYRAGFKGMRTEYIAPPSLKGEVMADDGKKLAHLIPKDKVLKMRPSRLAALRMRSHLAEEAFERGHLKVELVGRDRVAGREAYVIQVSPRHRSKEQTRKFWVDTDKWVKLKTEDISGDGTVLSMSYYTRIEFVDSIPEDKFRIDPAPGVRVEHERPSGPPLMPIEKLKREAGFRILEPSYLPAGFKLVGGNLMPFRSTKLVVLRYTDGVTSFSLFQAPEHVLDRKFLERLHQGPVRPGKGVYSWRENGLNLTIVGHLHPDQIRKIAASVK